MKVPINNGSRIDSTIILDFWLNSIQQNIYKVRIRHNVFSSANRFEFYFITNLFIVQRTCLWSSKLELIKHSYYHGSPYWSDTWVFDLVHTPALFFHFLIFLFDDSFSRLEEYLLIIRVK